MFAGRHLGEEEFDRSQDYADARLAALPCPTHPGIVQGLEIKLGPRGVAEGGFTVTPGTAMAGNGQVLGLYYPLRMAWQTLIDDYLEASGAASPTGVYYLMLRRAGWQIDSREMVPCQRAEFDPTRDSRLEVVATLALERLTVNPALLTSDPPASRELIENWIAADRVDGAFMAQTVNAVPLALLAVAPAAGSGYAVRWISVEAGRYEAVADSGYRVLLNQTTAAMRRVMQQAATDGINAGALPAYIRARLRLDFLPAAGQLPLEWLRSPAAPRPNLIWLSPHLGIDMVPVPEEAVLELLERHVARRVIDLNHPAGDQIRLLLAVNEPNYQPDLLDIPQTDADLERDIYRYFMRIHDAWLKWHQQFDLLYGLSANAKLSAAQIKALGLPMPEKPPAMPEAIFRALIARATVEFSAPGGPRPPYPYNKPIPTPPDAYTQWLVPGDNDTHVPPKKPQITRDGLIACYAVAQVELEAIENQIRAMRTRLEKTRDFLLLQRQQLDTQTVSLAALAGGVAGDGSGLQVARWLPYLKLNTSQSPESGVQADSAAVAAPAAQVNVSAPSAAPSAKMAEADKKTFSSNILTKAISSVALESQLLLKKPQTISSFELGINKSRLEMLAHVTKAAVSKPAYQTKEYRFGVLEHVSPEINEYAKTYYGMKDLLKTINDLFDPADAKSLRLQMERAGRVDEEGTAPADPALQPPSNRLEDPKAIEDRATKKATTLVDGQPQVDIEKRGLLANQGRYEALFKAGKILTQWIAIIEARYNSLERKLEGKLREQAAKLSQIEKLAGQIKIEREKLEALDRVRVEKMGDYGVAQRLLDEDWRRVYARDQERTRILTKGVLGLYYVRVRGTPVSAPLADPLALRHGSSADIVPGCDWREDVDLPAELTVFFNAVSEIPMEDWSALRGLRHLIPPVQQFDYLDTLRQTRFKARPAPSHIAAQANSLQARLMPVQQQTHAVLQQWSAAVLPRFLDSSNRTQAAAAQVLSLEDLNAMAAGQLRKPAHELREKLEHCVYCLLEKLNLLPPSLRLQWGQLAEDDQLRLEEVAWWPGLEKAEHEEFNTTRTVAELIAWWFRQIDAKSSANSRGAMRNMIRAALIFASLGDPAEILRGHVYVPPRAVALGERLQLKLNRAPAQGTRLQLLDTQQRVVAVLAVEDHSAQSTQAKIVEMIHTEIRINTRFNVVADKRKGI
jgi:hypothetical protein